MKIRFFLPLSLFALTLLPSDALDTAAEPDSPQERRFGGQGPRLVFKDRVQARWFGDNTKFWYRNDLAGESKEFVLVDAAKGVRQPAFDHTRLAAALAAAAGREVNAAKLPFAGIEFTPDLKAVRFKVDDAVWECTLEPYECRKLEGATLNLPAEGSDDSRRRGRGNRGPRRGEPRGDSPDGNWKVSIRDHNVFLHAKDGKEHQLTSDGTGGQPYGRVSWSPDSKTMAAFRIEAGERKETHLFQSSPREGFRGVVKSRPYPLPGDKFARFEISLFAASTGSRTKPQVELFEHEWLSPELHWSRDGTRVAWQQVDRGHQRLRIIEVNAETGAVRNLVDEKSSTFIWTAHTENLQLELVNWLEKSDEIVYVSEMDGWRHLYLVDRNAGAIKQITKGEWVVRGIDRIDEEKRQLWFHASGCHAGQDPYFLHRYRVNFDGSGFTALTDGDGTHSVEYSPDRNLLIDTYSRVDTAPVTELRRTSDGSLVCTLEKADISSLTAAGWQVPEVFVAKGRDGKTDIWGIICRPKGFDPSKKYPVIEQIYAGPQGSFVPKSFSPRGRFEELTSLGFIVVQMDGMGTANRSKAFHDVCFKNLRDAGFPDRILWHKAAAEKYPHYDTSRVGIYGGSAGGQNAAAAVLFHPDFYKAAVAGSGCHDNRMDKASWNEQWMGYPVGPQYAESSNLENAGKLRGRLMLIVGELDENVPVESTYRFVDALIRAGKDFDFVMVPNAGHGMGGSYGERRKRDFFLRHLAGAAPPDRNTDNEAREN